MRRRSRLGAAALAAALGLSCGASSRPAMAPASTPGSGAGAESAPDGGEPAGTARTPGSTDLPDLGPRPDQIRADIAALEHDNQANLDRLGLEISTPVGLDPRPMADIRRVCTPATAPSQTCGDVCRLADRICDNAESICELAGKLPGDAWAAGKCDTGKAACEKARTRCCGCR